MTQQGTDTKRTDRRFTIAEAATLLKGRMSRAAIYRRIKRGLVETVTRDGKLYLTDKGYQTLKV